MTLDDIQQNWLGNGLERLIHDGEEEVQQTLWYRLINPTQRCWFQACRHAVKANDIETLEKWLNEEDECKQAIMCYSGGDDVFRAHLLCARTILQHGCWMSNNRTVPDDALCQEVADKTRLPMGFLQDLTQELLTEEQKLEEEKRKVQDDLSFILCGDLRPAEQEQLLPVLLVELDTARRKEDGVVADLTLELMPDGNRMLYPIPALALVPRDEAFRQAENNARQYVHQCLKLWPEGYDVRWRLQIREKPLFPRLGGNSAGAAFALGLLKLLVRE